MPRYEKRVHNVLLCAVVSLFLCCYGLVVAEAGVPHADGITVWTETFIKAHWQGNTHTDPIWLVQLVAEDEQRPVVLGLVWQRETAGWFTSWKLQLYSETGVVDLLTTSPTREQTYRAALSYDQATGAYSTQVTDTTGQRLASIGGFLEGSKGSLQPHVPDGVAYTSQLIETEPVYVPVATEWLVGSDRTPRNMSPTVLSPEDSLPIRIDTHGSYTPGEFHLYIRHADGRELITTLTVETDEIARFVVSPPYPVGRFTVEMEYVDGSRSLLSQSAEVSNGQVQFRLQNVSSDARSGLLSGVYEVTSPFDLPRTTLRIEGELAALEWSETDRTYMEHLLLPVEVHEFSVSIIQGTNSIPFNVPAPLETQGTLWRLRLDPVLAFPIHTVSHVNETSFTLQADACVFDVMSFNIRVASSDGVNTWPNREPLVRRLFTEYAPAIIALQEPSIDQLYDLEHILTNYRNVRIRPDARARVHNALFYRPDVVELLAWSSFSLSDTPDIAQSATWGNTEARAALWARFRLLSTGQEFYVINTHFHHIDSTEYIRTRSAQLIAEYVRTIANGLPVLLMGDFNAMPDTSAHMLLTHGGDALFNDAWNTAAQRIGPEGTFHGFSGRSGGNRIDWLLVTPGVDVMRAEHVTIHEGDVYPSDHYPVHVSICLPRQ